MTSTQLSEDWKLETPVIFVIFNRPDTTSVVFEKIAKARPPVLLVVADAPRVGRHGEADLCYRAREIISRVDWPCRVHTNYADVNLGCRRRIISGLDWAFDLVDEAIILEDDCVPTPGFFRFCEELLHRYRDDHSIAQIGGVNFQNGICRNDYSYYFSRHGHIWGWATWRRAWRLRDGSLEQWRSRLDGKWLKQVLPNWRERMFWGTVFDGVASGKIDAWSYEWILTTWLNGMLSIVPSSNLVSNIGFGPEATHTKTIGPQANMPTEEIEFPLEHPPTIERHQAADDFTDRTIFSRSTRHQLSKLIKQKLRSFVSPGRTA